jgi:hypothetical protein
LNVAPNKDGLLATDLLKESVNRLNITNQNADFRKNASSVIAAMLEARLNKKPTPPTKSIVEVQKKMDDVEFPLPPPPPPITQSKPLNNDHDLPLPPPPSLCKIPASILTPPLSSDENDLPQKPIRSGHGGSDGINDNGIEKVNYRHKKQHHHANNQSSDSHNNNVSSTFGAKAELSTHARDRRSYIEKNNNNNNEMISFNGAVDKDTIDTIANGIANGQHPVCDKCKCKITR